MKTKNRTLGFNLIELLVVVGVVAVLSAILFPTFAKVREKAREMSCASNMRQIGLALQQYVQDDDGVYPDKGNDCTQDGCGTWATEITHYVKSNKVWACPSNPNKGSGFGTHVSNDYACNSWFMNKDNGMNPMGNGLFSDYGEPGVKNTSIQDPAQLIAVVENPGSSVPGGNSSMWDFRINDPQSGSGAGLFTGHGGASNFLFADGHVKTMKPFDTVDAMAGGSAPLNMWARDGVSFDSDDAQAARTVLSATFAHHHK